MAEYVRKRQEPRSEGMTRRDRQGYSYGAYLPGPLAGSNPTLPSGLTADIVDAGTAIRNLNETGTSHLSLEGLARFLLRARTRSSACGCRQGGRRSHPVTGSDPALASAILC